MNEKLNIEELFKSRLEGLEETPSDKVWKSTYRALRRKQFMRFRWEKFNVFYAAGLLLAGAALTLVLVDDFRESGRVNDEPDGTEAVHDLLQDTITHDSEAGTGEQHETGAMDASAERKAAKNAAGAGEPDPAGRMSDSLADTGKEAQDFINREPVRTLIPYFTPSVYEGCAPLTVEFINVSVNAEEFTWSFGQQLPEPDDNQAPLNDYRPSATYRYPGTYTITLVAKNRSGMQRSYSQQIVVHAAPRAEFEVLDGNIYNYSMDAVDFKWVLLPEGAKGEQDQTGPVSTEFQPSLDMLLPETSRLKPEAALMLIATNTTGCSDTAIAPLPDIALPTLSFPNAFTPNPYGPSGGYYNPNEPGNHVFFPRYNEKPVSFKLHIFSKSGEIIFESNEPERGWDGYYREALVPRGVYIYQCSGMWKNGEMFSYRGDVTVL